MRIYDLIIIGAGPAGITAGVYASRRRLDFLIISPDVGGQAAWSGGIENYTGYQFITGPELAVKFQEHIRSYEAVLKEGEEAVSLLKDKGAFLVKTDKDNYYARSVVIASGKRPKELGVPGEKEFKNRGLTYCAICDGPLFRDKDVVVVGGGNSALDAVLQMSGVARKIYVVNSAPSLAGDAVMRQKVGEAGNVTVFNAAQVVSVSGGKFVERVKIRNSAGESELQAQGVFVEIGLIPNSAFSREVEKNAAGEIMVDARNQTNIPGIFAAGDVTDVPEKQIIVAAGEGAKAALGAFRFLSMNQF
ncbi:MAG: FAD-dependent oxidoreductase [Candidatus Omnitrophica bacterium]|nr:FAD-dependent oxidoreductase [Candidatus Omnitrophota bacterium]MDD5042247.1 FAD-dependent oxidoreductase [Candidatus Omnitrophota bacterium]MDD5500102.1 FAD-dependent oxidoreductase [Candidatus Omnitrophota bacterium]